MMAFTVAGLAAQDKPQPQPPAAPAKGQPELQQRQQKKTPPAAQEEIPPEEDKGSAPEEFSFNPLEAEKWINVGNQYFKRGRYRAAENRYRGATKWNEGNAEAWLKLAETEEKLKDSAAAREAYTKYLEVAPDSKNAPQIRKKLEKLK